jgi:hypothetical protein
LAIVPTFAVPDRQRPNRGTKTRRRSGTLALLSRLNGKGSCIPGTASWSSSFANLGGQRQFQSSCGAHVRLGVSHFMTSSPALCPATRVTSGTALRRTGVLCAEGEAMAEISGFGPAPITQNNSPSQHSSERSKKTWKSWNHPFQVCVSWFPSFVPPVGRELLQAVSAGDWTVPGGATCSGNPLP